MYSNIANVNCNGTVSDEALTILHIPYKITSQQGAEENYEVLHVKRAENQKISLE